MPSVEFAGASTLQITFKRTCGQFGYDLTDF